MAFRIHELVVRGEIDNRVRGKVTGTIWLAGVEAPLRLDLTGHCSPDMAGCVLRFENPAPAAADDEPVPGTQQDGVAGDMTASRKVRILEVSVEEAMRRAKAGEPVPEHMGNSIYLEWFSEANGRVVIESADYKIEISEPAWRLTPEEEKQQAEASAAAMEQFFARATEGLGALPAAKEEESSEEESDEPWDEFRYEQLFRESDARADKFGELMEKYIDHPDRDEIIAREMGWDWLDEAIEEKAGGAEGQADDELVELPEEPEPDPAREGIDWMRNERGDIQHPLALRSLESAMGMHHFCKDHGLLGETADPDLLEMMNQFHCAGAKLAGALNGFARHSDHFESGFIVAALKRALNFVHGAVTAAAKVEEKKLLPIDPMAAYRDELFAIREEILALMKRFRETT